MRQPHGVLRVDQPGRRGFTLIEILMVMLVIGILSGLAVPVYRGVVERAAAARIISDVRTIHLAAAGFFADERTYPGSAPVGRVPPELADRLPENFPFAFGTVQYRYRRWAAPDTRRWQRRSDRGLPLVGVEIFSDSPSLLRHLEALSQGRGQFVGANGITIVLE